MVITTIVIWFLKTNNNNNDDDNESKRKRTWRLDDFLDRPGKRWTEAAADAGADALSGRCSFFLLIYVLRVVELL